ncbi:MAG: PDGLE domain-containing protein [Actinobacteria bacterium]|nr:PDGLE domain-containing protein [Actinomycetota bacterium]MBU1943382.1 PDGLE domain-containing protein [Actinomycetota bacterium]MBU2686739.1 PDGLE domain-containing protein [Actinomycetota bacterium]
MPDRIRDLFKGKHVGLWVFIGAALVVAVGLAVFASPFASRSPDGLERTVEQEGLSQRAREGESPLADYEVPGIRDEGASTGLAGLVGVLVTLALALGAGALLYLVAKRRSGRAGDGPASATPPVHAPPTD